MACGSYVDVPVHTCPTHMPTDLSSDTLSSFSLIYICISYLPFEVPPLSLNVHPNEESSKVQLTLSHYL